MLTPPVSESDHAQGPLTAAITLVEYGDYHRPQCGTAQPWLKSLQARMGDQLCLVFRHFPESLSHSHVAEAAEAAGLQGRFWGMHDTLLAHQSALDNGHLVEYARDLGLDTGRFLRDMARHVSAERVRLDLVSGAMSGVEDTPAFFVNGVRHFGSWNEGLSFAMSAPPEDTGDISRWADDGAPQTSDGSDEWSVRRSTGRRGSQTVPGF